MKYKPTLLNITSAILIIWTNYTYWTSGHKNDREGWGMLAYLVLTGAGLLGLLIDFVLQKSLKNYWAINGIELLIIGGIFIYDKWQEREKTIVIPENFKGYVSIVYEVKEAPPLYRSSLNFGYTIEIPQSGILFTSTPQDKDIWDTRFKTASGIILDHSDDTTKLHPHPYDDGEHTCNEESWKFRTWLVNNSTGWNKNIDVDTVTLKAIENYCREGSH